MADDTDPRGFPPVGWSPPADERAGAPGDADDSQTHAMPAVTPPPQPPEQVPYPPTNPPSYLPPGYESYRQSGASSPYGPPQYGAQYGPSSGYPPPGYGQPSYGPSPYGPPEYGPPEYGPPGYGQAGYGQAGYGQPGYGQPAYQRPDDDIGLQYESGDQQPVIKHSLGWLRGVLVALVLIAIVALVVVLTKPSFLYTKKLSNTAVEQTIEQQSKGRGDFTNVSCPSGQKAQAGVTFTCTAAGGKKITVNVTSDNGDYTWTPVS